MRADHDRVAVRRRLAAALRERYEAGATVGDLAAECGRSARTVRRWLVEAEATLRSPTRPADSVRTRKVQTAARARLMATPRTRYEAGKSVPALADDVGCSVTKIYRPLRKAGTTMRSPHKPTGPSSRQQAQPP